MSCKTEIVEKELKQALRFLKDKNVWHLYKRNYINHPNECNTNNIIEDLKSSIERCYKTDFIFLESNMIGFYWAKSEEGRAFWNSIASEFKKNKNN